MLLGKVYGETEEAPGEWFVWKQEGAEKIELLIRPLPPADRQRIRSKHLGKKRKLRIALKGVEQDLDTAAQDEAQREMAAFCLLDSRGFEFEPGPGLAARLSTLLGAEVKAGEPVSLDGRWSDAVKHLMLRSYVGANLQAFIDETVTKLLGEAEEEEAQASGN
jgi:hypothetical protein